MDKPYLVAEVKITMPMRDGEDESAVNDRLYDMLFAGLCKSEDGVEFEYMSSKVM